MSEEFLGVIIDNAQNDIRKAAPVAALPALGAMAARLVPALGRGASKVVPMLGSKKLDAAALVAAPFTGGMSTAALAGARGLRAGQLSRGASTARAGAKEAGEAAAKTGEKAVADYVDAAAPKTKGGLPDKRFTVSRRARELETRPHASRVAEGSMETKVGTSAPATLESYEPGGSGAVHSELSQQASTLQAEADTLSQQAKEAASGTILPAAGTVAVQAQNRMQRKRMEDAQNAERQKQRAEEAMNTHKRGVGGASTTSGFGNMGSPTPQIQGY